MKIPRYWKQVFRQVDGVEFAEDYCRDPEQNTADITAWGYSDISMDDALEQANKRVDTIVKALANGTDDNFYYPLYAVHEDIVESLQYEGCGDAVVTRNRYFSQVLNTADMMFVDIDIPTYDLNPPTFWQKLFGKAKVIEEKNRQEIENRVERSLDKVANFVSNAHGAGFLAYRTFAGLRLIATHKTFDPTSLEVQKIFDALGTDSLYQMLCKAQNSFRARLTPKHWRLEKDLGYTPRIKFRITPEMMSQWTADSQEKVKEYDQWIKTYETEHRSHASCRFIKSIGNPAIASALKPLIEYHDKATQAHSGKPLA